jgi:hypothetical protein
MHAKNTLPRRRKWLGLREPTIKWGELKSLNPHRKVVWRFYTLIFFRKFHIANPSIPKSLVFILVAGLARDTVVRPLDR